LSRVNQEFYWPGVHECVTRYVASGDLCQRNVSKGTVPKAPMRKLLLISTPFSTICVDIIGPISPPSDGYRYILTTIDMCSRFREGYSYEHSEIRELLDEYNEIFSDVPRVTHLIEHKVELTETEPVKHKPYPIPYKMLEIIDKEIDEMLRMGVIEHSEAPYASSLVLVKKTR